MPSMAESEVEVGAESVDKNDDDKLGARSAPIPAPGRDDDSCEDAQLELSSASRP